MAIPIYCFTYNCAKLANEFIEARNDSPVYDEFFSNLSKKLPKAKPRFLVFGFQELCSILDGSFPSAVLKSLDQLAEQLVELLKYKYGFSQHFAKLRITNLGALGLIIIESPVSGETITDVTTASSSCGYLYSSLKGACGIRFHLHKNGESTIFTFVCCHLNANEGFKNWKRRNQNVVMLMRSLDFNDGYGVLRPDSHVFIMGDMNYRAMAHLNDKDKAKSSNDESQRLLSTRRDSYKSIETIDELTISRSENEAFWGFDEGVIKFAPTYKFFANSDKYNEKRVPSWCDRVLFQSYTDSHEFKVLDYNSLPEISLSDHKPVQLIIQVPFAAPKSQVINENGYLVNGSVYLKPTKHDKLVRAIGYVADTCIGYGLYGLTDPHGRMYFMGFMLLSFLFTITFQ